MPLVFVLLVIVVVFVNIFESSKKGRLQDQQAARILRRTNAKLERELVDHYMKQGLTLNESISLTYNDLIKKGFDPAIPPDAYYQDKNGKFESSETIEPLYKYESDAVSNTESLIILVHKKVHPGEPLPYSDEEYTSRVYKWLPKTMSEYDLLMDALYVWGIALPLHTMVIHETYGLCEIVDFVILPGLEPTKIGAWKFSAYKLQSVKTKEIYVSNIKRNEVRKF